MKKGESTMGWRSKRDRKKLSLVVSTHCYRSIIFLIEHAHKPHLYNVCKNTKVTSQSSFTVEIYAQWIC